MRLLTLLLTVATAAQCAAAEFKITIKTLPAQMKYDTEKFAVPPGAEVTVTFENHDEMPHNLVFCRPSAGPDDKGLEVAQAGWALGEKGIPAGWIPQHPRVLAHSKLLDPHKTEVIKFTAPDKAGVYPFVCTVPGHAAIMNGSMRVQTEPKPIVGLHYRYFEGDFKDFPSFQSLTPLTSGPLPSGKLDPKADPATEKRKNRYALEFEGVLEAPENGEYEFVLASDDGTELLIDKKAIIDNKKAKNTSKFITKKITLKKGEHPIIVRYHQGSGAAVISLTWSGPGFENVALSTANLTQKLREDEKAKYVGLPLKPEAEPIIYRNFIEGGSARGIGVGYPGGVNVNWDANSMSVAEVWQGSFIDAKRHWTDRGVGFQPPSGFGLIKPVQAPVLPLFHADGDEKAADLKPEPGVGQPIAALTSPDQPWPQEDSRAAGYRFRGYELNAQRQPVFRYETPGASVTDAFAPGAAGHGATLVRTITVKTKAGAKTPPLFFRVAAAKGAKLDGDSAVLGDVKIGIAGGQPTFRPGPELGEVIVPLEFKNGQSTLTLTYAWPATHQH